ncbi:GTP-binding protein Rit2 [Nephila pilipes]|uniref:GTP-binding protein Rit2 n=1 Tax=Nephila pilipes TaxID=299642 RepID=A0A8X6JQQ6_NEPPI|nr:GTP-binding protein Rit2 [Nephila pilipes]
MAVSMRSTRIHERLQSLSCCCLQPPRSKSEKRRSSSFSTGATTENIVFLLGFSDVGKSSIAERHERHQYTEGHKDYIERVYSCSFVRADGISHRVTVADTPASTFFPRELNVQIIRGKGFLVVFAVDNAESFQEANRLLNLIQSIRGDSVPIILVGNKADLEERQVASQEAQELANEYSNCKYIEASARTSYNVQEAFLCLFELGHFLKTPTSVH